MKTVTSSMPLWSQLRHDPWAVAETPVLDVHHPLREHAGIIARALEQVTSGHTEETTVAPLAKIPRSSPFAPFVLGIRAIHALYQGDTERARMLVTRINPRSPAVKLGNGVRALSGERFPMASKALRRLSAIAAAQGSLQGRLGRLDQTYGKKNPSYARKMTAEFLQDVEGSQAHLCRRVREEVARRWFENEWPLEDLETLLPDDGAEALRFLALGCDSHPDVSIPFWLDYHAKAQLTDPDRALILRHVAQQAQRSPSYCSDCGVLHSRRHSASEAMETLRHQALIEGLNDKNYELLEMLEELTNSFQSLEEEEDKPSGEISPMALLNAARDLDPKPEVFVLQLDFLEDRRNTTDELTTLLTAWHAQHPSDVRPLLRLADLASQRNASRQAVSWIEQAEAADPLNPDVRRKKLQLLLVSALRRLKSKKHHLVRKDLETMKALERTEDVARQGVIAAIEAIMHAHVHGTLPLEPVTAALGNATSARLMVQSVATHTGHPTDAADFPTSPSESLAAQARGALDFNRHGNTLSLPLEGLEDFLSEFGTHLKPGILLELPLNELVSLASLALEVDQFQLTLRCTDEALLKKGAERNAALFLHRGDCLGELGKRERARACLNAAFTLARRQGEPHTAQRASECLEDHFESYQHLMGEFVEMEPPTPLSDEVLNDVLRREHRQATTIKGGQKSGSNKHKTARSGATQQPLPF